MTLDFECDSKDMDERTADLLEAGSLIYHLVIDFSPDLEAKDDLTKQAIINAAFTKGVNVLQLITGIDHKDASECLFEACQRESNLRNAEYIKRQMGWEEND